MSEETSQNHLISTAMSSLRTILSSTWTQIGATINNNLPPETREQIKQNLDLFARSRPILATLVLSQLALSGIPLLFFISLTAGIFIFNLVTALLLSVLGALMVTLFCMGLGSLILIPTLFVTTLTAGGIWLWGWGLYYAVQWIGSGDMTRLSLLLSPQRQEKVDREDGPKQDEDETRATVYNNALKAPVQDNQRDSQIQRKKDKDLNTQVSTESNILRNRSLGYKHAIFQHESYSGPSKQTSDNRATEVILRNCSVAS
ncbi:hypothetical protein EYB25_004489 [Talaromyces marneffei]|nr:uncharacterized protein EYB26_004429 [Talaromyces marneffei]KAE8553110.1 hypothetical protein EYB25_004489 [Talaromyces marneffei]QGA16759.1 hypothetical protein EYB26_004429 [Talaromyces marneffei]